MFNTFHIWEFFRNEFVFRWHPCIRGGYTLLCRLRRLISSWLFYMTVTMHIVQFLENVLFPLKRNKLHNNIIATLTKDHKSELCLSCFEKDISVSDVFYRLYLLYTSFLRFQTNAQLLCCREVFNWEISMSSSCGSCMFSGIHFTCAEKITLAWKVVRFVFAWTNSHDSSTIQ